MPVIKLTHVGEKRRCNKVFLFIFLLFACFLACFCFNINNFLSRSLSQWLMYEFTTASGDGNMWMRIESVSGDELDFDRRHLVKLVLSVSKIISSEYF